MTTSTIAISSITATPAAGGAGAVKKPVEATAAEIEILRLVGDGCDVFAYGLAGDIRRMQREGRPFIRIVKARGKYHGAQQLPYFGAKLTAKGRAALAARATRGAGGEE